MSEETRALIAYRSDRAREALDEARLLLNAGHGNATVNRLYYACFYAVSALLLADGLSASEHTHLRSILHRDYVRSGRVPQEMGKHFDLLFNSRQESDYADLVTFRPKRFGPGWGRRNGSSATLPDLSTRARSRPSTVPYEDRL